MTTRFLRPCGDVGNEAFFLLVPKKRGKRHGGRRNWNRLRKTGLPEAGVLAKSLSEKEMERVASGELADTTGTLLSQLQNYNTAHLFFSTLLSGFIYTLIIYIATKSYKVKADNPLKLKDIPKFNKMFKDLFLLSVANVAINVLLSALGIFSLGGIFY